MQGCSGNNVSESCAWDSPKAPLPHKNTIIWLGWIHTWRFSTFCLVFSLAFYFVENVVGRCYKTHHTKKKTQWKTLNMCLFQPFFKIRKFSTVPNARWRDQCSLNRLLFHIICFILVSHLKVSYVQGQYFAFLTESFWEF